MTRIKLIFTDFSRRIRANQFNPRHPRSILTHFALSTAQVPLLLGWVAVMIALPIVGWFGGGAATLTGVLVGVLCQFAIVISVLAGAWGWRRTLQVLVTVVALAWAVEFLGSHTGFPFGVYAYTDKLQPQMGGVPLLIPLAWMMMLPPAWAVAQRMAGPRTTWQQHLRFIVLSALAFTAWDLFLDPQMVAWDLWRWANPGGPFPLSYFGIPWTNYAGWLVGSALITAIVRPRPLPATPLLLIYTITWALESIGLAFFWGLSGPALVGFVGMGGMLVLAIRGGGKGNGMN